MSPPRISDLQSLQLRAPQNFRPFYVPALYQIRVQNDKCSMNPFNILLYCSIGSMKLSYQKELNLNLYRHWSISESLHHTIYTAAKFKIWTHKGKQKLSEFLAELGLPLVQGTIHILCWQKFWPFMTISFRD